MHDFEHLAAEMSLAPPASAEAIERAIAEFGNRLPAEYVQFLRTHNGAEGALGELVAAEELAFADDKYPELDHLAGLVVFGSDGGLEAFAFDERGQVLVIPWIGGREDAVSQGSFVDFTKRLVSGELFERPAMAKKLSRADLIELVAQIQRAEFQTDEEHNAALALFEANVPDPEASDLIYYPAKRFGPGREPTAEEVVDEALKYRPIQLGPGG